MAPVGELAHGLVIGMLRDDWWWPWWVSSLIDLGVVFVGLAIFRISGRRIVRAAAAALALAGLVAAVLAPIVMTERSGEEMQNDPAMPSVHR
jgi:hypothetical protein